MQSGEYGGGRDIMKASELREMTDRELEMKLSELREDLFHLKVKKKLGELEDVAKVQKVKRDIARILTIMNERKRKGVKR